MMAARRCSTCSIDWPYRSDFEVCPGCHESTSYLSDETAISYDDAKALAQRLHFEHKYEQRGERPLTPEHAADLARVEATIAEIQALNAIPVAGEPLPVEPLKAYEFGKDAHLLARDAHPMDDHLDARRRWWEPPR